MLRAAGLGLRLIDRALRDSPQLGRVGPVPYSDQEDIVGTARGSTIC